MNMDGAGAEKLIPILCAMCLCGLWVKVKSAPIPVVIASPPPMLHLREFRVSQEVSKLSLIRNG